MAKVTMRQIANQAGVSPTVVSHVLNDTPGTFVAQKTKTLVLQTAKKLGYHNSLISRSIKKSLKHLAIATTNRRLEYFDANRLVFDAFRRVALERNYFSVDLPLDVELGGWTKPAVIREMIELYRTKLVDGYLIDKVEFTNDAILKLKKHKVPMVIVNGEPFLKPASKDIQVSSVITNTFLAGKLAVDHLAGLGHANIALLSSPYSRFEKVFHPYMVSQLRKGFLAGLEEADIKLARPIIVDGDPSERKTTESAVANIFKGNKRPTGLVVGNDCMSIVALQKLTQMGLSVPGDVSVVSIGGSGAIVGLSDKDLTCIKIPYEQNGQRAAEMLIDKIEGKSKSEELKELDCELVKGKTTAKLG